LEALNIVLTEVKNKQLFRGIEFGKDKVDVSYLQFADGALIMGEWSKPNIKNLSRILTCFHLASGLKKAKALSLSGRLTLTKSIAGSLGVYYFLTPKAPKMVISKIERKDRKWFNQSVLARQMGRKCSTLLFVSKDFCLDSQPEYYVSDRSPIASSVVSASSLVRSAIETDNMPQNIYSQQPTFHLDNQMPARPHELLFCWVWTRLLRSEAELINDSRVFSAKGVRKLIASSISTNESRTRWNNLVPIKVNISYWRIKNQRIPTRVNLDYRGIDLYSIRCPVCDDDLETEEHILVNCVVAKNTWAEILNWINHIRIDNLNEVFTSASRANLPSNLTVVFDAVIQSTL
nr:RNA-directed DNA polymerase, eukaryota, reverse transcriptase zinc-binding domain protein [Tanacetum cinerariifolium]